MQGHERLSIPMSCCVLKGNKWTELALPDSEVSAKPIPEIHQLNPCQKTRTTLSAIYLDKVAEPIVMNNTMQQMTWII
jgi:hypothetical protein